ncbi:MAG: MerR family transcriptional regulator [Halanaerobiaceae bacterium]
MSEEKDIPMRVVKEKTGLSSRQIRYYDEVNLIFPDRSPGNQRLFSESDISKLKKIKKLLDEGYNINSIKKKLNPPKPVKKENEKEKSLQKDFNKYTGNRLSSLYPVSNRSYLNKLLNQKDKKEEENK